MYLTGRALHIMSQSHNSAFTAKENAALKDYQAKLDKSTKFIPNLGEGGRSAGFGFGHDGGLEEDCHYCGREDRQGAYDLCTGRQRGTDHHGDHLRSRYLELAGFNDPHSELRRGRTMAANRSGLHLSMVRNIAAGWVFTLPAAALLSGLLYFLFDTIF